MCVTAEQIELVVEQARSLPWLRNSLPSFRCPVQTRARRCLHWGSASLIHRSVFKLVFVPAPRRALFCIRLGRFSPVQRQLGQAGLCDFLLLVFKQVWRGCLVQGPGSLSRLVLGQVSCNKQ